MWTGYFSLAVRPWLGVNIVFIWPRPEKYNKVAYGLASSPWHVKVENNSIPHPAFSHPLPPWGEG
jgi:hypothetical protein